MSELSELAEAHRLVLAGLGADGARLGSGGEATVYALDERRVVRILHGLASPIDDELTAVYRRWEGSPAADALGFALPTVLEDATSHGVHWQVLRRITGREVGQLLAHAPAQRRAELLARYVDASSRLGQIDSAPGYRTLLGGTSYATWGDCLRARVEVSPAPMRARVAELVADFDVVIGWFDTALEHAYDGPAKLVHVDYFPGNVLAADTLDGYRVTGVLDFASHSLFGDPLLDVAGAVVMADLDTGVTPAERAELGAYAVGLCGDRLADVMEVYRVFYALYYAMDEGLIRWSAQHLNEVSDGRGILA